MTPSRSNSQKSIRVQVIDPQQITLWGIRHLINSDNRFDVCASSTNGIDALRARATDHSFTLNEGVPVERHGAKAPARMTTLRNTDSLGWATRSRTPRTLSRS